MLTTLLPYQAKSPRELFHQLLTQAPVPLGQARRDLHLPKAVEVAVMRGLAREPAKRQRSVVAFAGELTTSASQPEAAARGGLLR